MSSREKLRLNRALKEINIKNTPEGLSKSGLAGGSKSSMAVSPLRQRQQEELEQARNLRKKGMVGELTRIFLGYDFKDPEDQDDDEQETDGIEGYDDSKQTSRNNSKARKSKLNDTEDEDLTNLQKMYMERLETNSKINKKSKKQREEQSDDEPGDFGDELAEGLGNEIKKPTKPENSLFEPEGRDLSSIRSENSEFTPNRREVGGRRLTSPMQPSMMSKQDSRITFDKDKDLSGIAESKRGSQVAFDKKLVSSKMLNENNDSSSNNLKVPRFNSQVFDSNTGTKGNYQKSPTESDKDGAQLNSAHKSARESAASGDRSASRGTVIGVKKRDKSNLMENLARIHAQREEDARDMNENDDESDDNRQINWEQRIRDLKDGKQKRKFRVPGERMDERAKKRKEKDRGLDKWGVASVPRKRTFEKPKQLYKFKNAITKAEKVNITGVNIELLHTDELMAYYRELIMKGNRDLTDHHRLQNEIKKLEYQAVASTSPKPRSRSKSKNKDRNSRSRSIGEKKAAKQLAPSSPAGPRGPGAAPTKAGQRAGQRAGASGAEKSTERATSSPSNSITPVGKQMTTTTRKRPQRSKTPVTLGRKTVFP
jgi:hypothetical protein